MKIKIHRGKNQIGGNIVEVSTQQTKILLDVGLSLNEEENAQLPEIEGLFSNGQYDAVFLSHYHQDHIGLAYEIDKNIPIYIGEVSFNIIKVSNEYLRKATFEPRGLLKHKVGVRVNDITVTPYICDHSAYESFMLLIESGDEKILYTGDFRANGRKSYDKLLDNLPHKIDTLICEGTTLSRANYKPITEREIEKQAVKIFIENKCPVFVLQSSMNIDRIVSFYRAAKRSNRIFLQDLYMAQITSEIRNSIPNPIDFDDVKVFITRYYDDSHFRYKLFEKYKNKRIGKQQIINSRFVMCVRNSMLNYMKSLNKKMDFKEGVLIYSLWSGYKEQPEMKIFIDACKEMGLKIITLHTSGHADGDTIKALIKHVNPNEIIPIHTENPDWFDNDTKK